MIATIAVMVAILALHPSDQFAATVRRAIGFGSERPLPAPDVVRQGGTYRAVARISAATGLAFEDEGDTDDRPTGWHTSASRWS